MYVHTYVCIYVFASMCVCIGGVFVVYEGMYVTGLANFWLDISARNDSWPLAIFKPIPIFRKIVMCDINNFIYFLSQLLHTYL